MIKNLDIYKQFYVRDENHFYVSKIKQYHPGPINELSKGLKIFSDLLKFPAEKDSLKKFIEFAELDNDIGKKPIVYDKVTKLYLALELLMNELIDLSHLETVNKKKFDVFNKISTDYINNYTYKKIIEKYNKKFIENDLEVYARNFMSWFKHWGFCGLNSKKIFFTTEVGFEFINHCDDEDMTYLLFINQSKKYQIWNNRFKNKYTELQVIPYYLILELLYEIPGNYFTKQEFILFITKIKTHNKEDINQSVSLIKQFRLLSNEKQKAYISDIRSLDKKLFKKRRRTNYDDISDSASKEIDALICGPYTSIGRNEDKGNIRLIKNKKNEVKEELIKFRSKIIIHDFKNEYDWIRHFGSLNGMSMEDLIDLYINQDNKDIEIIKGLNDDEKIKELIEDKLFEKEVESYYEKNLDKINKNLKIVKTPNYGRQFPTPIGPIDLLCYDTKTKEYVVIEFKRNQVSDDTIGQILRYIGYVYINMSKNNKPVRGIIVGSDFSEKLQYSFVGVQSENFLKLVTTFSHPFTDKNKPPK